MSSAPELPNVDNLALDALNLKEAYRFKEQANACYSHKDFSTAIYWYHQCLLRARAVQQLSLFGLQRLARLERTGDASPDDMTDGLSTEGSSQAVDVGAADEALDGGKTGDRRKRNSSTSRGEEMKTEAIEITLKCYNNLAACILQGQNRTESDFLRAVEYCDKVLSYEPSNEKALYRKGMALSRANMHEKAIAVLKKCSSNNREAQTIIHECQRLLAEERRRRDDQVRRNFSRAFGARENGHRMQQEMNDGGANHLITMNGNANAAPNSEQ